MRLHILLTVAKHEVWKRIRSGAFDSRFTTFLSSTIASNCLGSDMHILKDKLIDTVANVNFPDNLMPSRCETLGFDWWDRLGERRGRSLITEL